MPAPTLDAVDRLHELAAEARFDVVVLLKQPHDGLVLAHGLELVRRKLLMAEVARHAQRRAAVLLLALAEAASAETDANDRRDQGEQFHPTATLSVKDWMWPRFSA